MFCEKVRVERGKTRQVSRARVKVSMLVCPIITWCLIWRIYCQLCFSALSLSPEIPYFLIVLQHYLCNLFSFNDCMYVWLCQAVGIHNFYAPHWKSGCLQWYKKYFEFWIKWPQLCFIRLTKSDINWWRMKSEGMT